MQFDYILKVFSIFLVDSGRGLGGVERGYPPLGFEFWVLIGAKSINALVVQVG